MPQIINTNISSLTAQRNLNNSQTDQATALQRLSSGLRINSAKDDAAGLAISTRFSSQTRGLTVAIRNAGDGISLAQTAEGALGSMTDSLQRIRELALQAANGTNSDSDRQALNAEAQQLISEITRTGEQTNFNGRNLLDGSFDSGFQIGANAGEVIDVKINKLTADELGVSDQSGVSAIGTDNALSNGDLIINGVAIRSSSASDDDASTDNAAASAISKAAAINDASDETGVKAVVDTNSVAGSQQTAADATGTIVLNGTTISIETTSDAASTRASVVAAINAQSELTGVTAVDTGDDNLGVTLEAGDGRNIELAFGAGGTPLNAANTGLAAAATYEGGYTLVAEGDQPEIKVEGGDGTGNGDLTNSGLSKGSYTPGVAAVSTTEQTAAGGPAVDSTTVGTGTFAATDYSGTNLVFTVTLGGATSTNITLAQNSDAIADVATDIQGQLQGQGGVFANATVTVSGGQLLFTDVGGASTNPISFTHVSGGGGNLNTLGLNTVTSTPGNAAAGTPPALDSGDLVINGVSIGAAQSGDDTASYSAAGSSSKTKSGISIAEAINKSTDATGVTATVNATDATGTTAATAGTAGETGALHLNGVEISLTVQDSAEANRTHAVDQINKVAGQTGVVATDNGVSLTLTAADGRNIVLALDNNDAGNGTTTFDADNFGLGGAGISETDITAVGGAGAGNAAARTTEANSQATTTYSTVSLSSAQEIEVSGGVNGNAALEELGFKAGSYGGGADGQFLKDVDISTLKGATEALTAIDNALDSVNAARADLGAVQNRFETTISNLAVAQENLTAANSRIKDADFASETAELSRTRVLQQAGISILAQANALPQQALSLLQ